MTQETTPTIVKKSNRKTLLIFLSLILFGIILTIGIFLLSSLNNNNQPDNYGLKPTQLDNNKPLNTEPSLDYSEDDYVYSGIAPVYVTIYSHNEDSWETMVNTKIKYIKYREGLLSRIDLLKEYDIEWDWQSDQPVIEAMIEYEVDPSLLSETDGKNILRYMHDLGISLDPHAHTNNYADIAYLMSELGVDSSSVIGGTVQVTCGDSYLGFLELDDWHSNIDLSSDGLVHGVDYTSATWDPKILSDPGMGGHYFDDWSSGIWRPGNGDDFYTHDPESDIVYVGEGYPHDSTIIGPEHASSAVVHAGNGEYIKELVEKIANKELPTGTKDGKKFIYTASVHVRDTVIVTDSEEGVVTVDGLRSFLDELEPLRDNGKIIYAKFEDVVDIWENEYDSVPWRIDLSSFSFYDDVKEQAMEYCDNRSK